MPPVDAISIPGLDLVFLSDDHWPPHFHAKRRGEWEIRVYIQTTTEADLHYDLKWPKRRGAGPDGSLQRELRKRVVKHREKLLKEWNEKVHFDPPTNP